MPLLTSFGFKKPQNSERNFWDALNENTQKVNDHSHNGADSTKLNTKDMQREVYTILPASWVATAGQAGHYQCDVALPTGIKYSNDNVNPVFYIDDSVVQLSCVKKSDVQMTVFINSNSLTVKIVYV